MFLHNMVFNHYFRVVILKEELKKSLPKNEDFREQDSQLIAKKKQEKR